MKKNERNNVRLDLETALRKWKKHLPINLREWGERIINDERFLVSLKKAAGQRVPVPELLDLILRLKKIEMAAAKREREVKQIRESLNSLRDDLAPMIRKLRRRGPALSYAGPDFLRELDGASRAFSRLPPRSLGQPKKTAETYRFVVLAAFLYEKIGQPSWDIVAAICSAAFTADTVDDDKELNPDSVKKRVIRQQPAQRGPFGTLADAIIIPPMEKVRKQDRRAWVALMFEQADRELADMETQAFQQKQSRKDSNTGSTDN